MSALTFPHLHAVNADRCINGWHHQLDAWTGSEWLTALGGEVGEALNVLKKLNRSRDGIIGNTRTVTELTQDLADELADAVIYADLTASHFGVAIDDRRDFAAFRVATLALNVSHLSPTMLGALVLVHLGHLAGVIADLEDDCRPQMNVALALGTVVRAVDALAAAMDIDLGAAVVSKFNSTSKKHGMPHRLEVTA